MPRKKRREKFSLKPKNIKTVSSIISELSTNSHLAELLKIGRILMTWDEVVSENFSKISKAVDFQKGVMIIKVDNSVFRNELYYFKKELIVRINEKLGEKKVYDLKFI